MMDSGWDALAVSSRVSLSTGPSTFGFSARIALVCYGMRGSGARGSWELDASLCRAPLLQRSWNLCHVLLSLAGQSIDSPETWT